jgi:hypothetical protein
MSFCTAINCMDGRVQLPVIAYLKSRFNVDYVDMVTEPGPNRILGRADRPERQTTIFERIDISVEKHGSVGLAVAGHYDCAGNPVPRDTQRDDTLAAMRLLKNRYEDLPVIGLWVDEDGTVQEVE